MTTLTLMMEKSTRPTSVSRSSRISREKWLILSWRREISSSSILWLSTVQESTNPRDIVNQCAATLPHLSASTSLSKEPFRNWLLRKLWDTWQRRCKRVHKLLISRITTLFGNSNLLLLQEKSLKAASDDNHNHNHYC